MSNPSSSTAPRVGSLEVHPQGDDGSYDGICPSNSSRHRIAEACVDLALSLLETKEGKQSLVDVATVILNELEKKKKGKDKDDKPIAYRYGLENLPFWIDKFLKSMRRSFPYVLLSEKVEGEAEAQRLDWMEEGNELKDYQPKDAGYLYLSSILMDNMVNASQGSGGAYAIFKFQMAISIAHEIVHFLTGFLTGTAKPDTPKKLKVTGFGNERRGEAGRYWEKYFLGGVVEFWSSKDDPLGLRQAGTPYIFEHGNSSARGHRVSQAYVDKFLRKDFSFPIRKEHGVLNRKTLTNELREETTWMRQRCIKKKVERPSSPTPGSNIVYRKNRQLDNQVEAGSSKRSWFSRK